MQRRHQKVLEEAPAPNVDQAMREAMGAAAINAARAVGYVGAGTVEFIVEQRDDGMSFYFMEMNTRLQVEHPVTEAITGTDLVEWQLRVAAGEPLPKTQDELTITGHAIEARICAENPDNNFLPATGVLKTYQKPAHTAFGIADVRIDDGVRTGDVISPYYDSMIAKLIVHGSTREEALARLDQALAQMHIVGLPNNVAFLRHVVASESFKFANLDTALIEREKAVLFHQSPLSLQLLSAAAVANALAKQSIITSQDPFASQIGFRAFGEYKQSFELVHHERAYQAVVSDWQDHAFTLTLSAITQKDAKAQNILQSEPIATVAVGYTTDDDGQISSLWLDGHRLPVSVYQDGETVHIFGQAGYDVITVIDKLAHTGDESSDGGSLKSPMPGQVVAFRVVVGDTVKKGQPLAVIEAMKIEHTIHAPADGVVSELLFAAGDLVADGDELLRLESQ